MPTRRVRSPQERQTFFILPDPEKNQKIFPVREISLGPEKFPKKFPGRLP
jgi:hypothetical protein